jgi:hypothetical protein
MTKKQPRKPIFPPRAKPEFPGEQPAARIDPIIGKRLSHAKDDDELSIIFAIKPPEEIDLSGSWARNAIAELIRKVTKIVGNEPKDLVIFEHMDMAGITAQASFIKVLIQQKEIVGAQDNNPDMPVPEDPPIQ